MVVASCVAFRMRSKISASPRTSSWAVGPQHRRGGRVGAVEGPGQAAEGDHVAATAALANVTKRSRGSAPAVTSAASDQNTTALAVTTTTRLAATGRSRRLRRLPARVVEPPPVAPAAVDGPTGEAEQPQLLGGRRVDGEPVRVVGVPLGLPHRVGLAVLPHPALAQQPVLGEPRAAEHERGPPRVGEEEGAGGQPRQRLDEARRDEVHRDVPGRSADAEVEVAPLVRSLASSGSSRCPMPGGSTLVTVSSS